MKRIKLDINNFSKAELSLVADEIGAGKVVALPTDTIYGLSTLANNKKAVGKIYQIKKRDKNKPLIVLMKSFCMIRRFCKLNKEQYNYLKNNLEKGKTLTVILKSKDKELEYLLGESEGLAIRIPKQSDFLMKLIKKINEPIVSTSLNLSGEKEILNLSDAGLILRDKKIDLIVDAGRVKKRNPSSIVDIRDINNIKRIR